MTGPDAAPRAGPALFHGGAHISGLGADGERIGRPGELDLVDGVESHRHPPRILVEARQLPAGGVAQLDLQHGPPARRLDQPAAVVEADRDGIGAVPRLVADPQAQQALSDSRGHDLVTVDNDAEVGDHD